VAIQYDPDRPPILAVRIQEIFGWKNTPRIAGGRVPLLLHLLAPNHRPQQITDDLASFWNNAYPIIRGELRRRYPRHAWPEDPWNALPERRPQSKRRDGS
jgi:ATP-dependent helicase HrpB